MVDTKQQSAGPVKMTLQPLYSREEFARRGDEIYERTVRPLVEPGNEGKFVVIDIETGAYEIDADELAASDRLLARVPDAQIWLRRIGSHHAHRFGFHPRHSERHGMRISAVRWISLLLFASFVATAGATSFGPTFIIQCPDSDKLLSRHTLASGNTFGGRRWSDGYAKYPMLPSTPQITRCDDQGKFFWVADAKVIGKIDPYQDPAAVRQAWRDAPNIRSLSEQEYLAAIAAGMGRNRKEELYLRMHAWWVTNAAFRDYGVDDTFPNPFLTASQARANLERLVKLLAPSDDQERLMKADALRQLGQFDEARLTLRATFPKEMEEVANWIRALVEKRDSLVREIPSRKK